MELGGGRFCIFLIAVLASGGSALSQQSGTSTTSGENFPTGVWESNQPDGTVVGIDLSAVPANVPGVVYPQGTPRPEGSCLQIGVFHGNSQTAHRTENFFVTSWTGPGSEYGSAAYANRRLEVNFHDPRFGLEVQLELAFDPAKDEWTGRFHRDSFDQQLTLRRPPKPPSSIAPTLLLASTGTPALFRVEIHNPDNQDLTLNLGIELANGTRQYPNAMSFKLTTPDGRILHLEPVGPHIIAGRVDPMIVPLPAGATFSFLVDLNEYFAPKEKALHLTFPSGSYTLQAEYSGKATPLGQTNSDVSEIALMNYWVGTSTSAPLAFTIGNEATTPDH
jgi:hypothetical protein